MSNTTYQTPEDEQVFKEILTRDPESRKCFECDYPNAPWCDINHGIFVCLDCSGVHRGLGVHLCFVRSSTMDGWSNWRPEKLNQMKVGGNSKARKFFESKGVPRAPIRERYNHVGAMMYKDKLEAEANGRPFSEAGWQPPGWAQNNNQQAQQQQQARTMGGTGGGGQAGNANSNRFQGVGSNGPANQQSRNDGGGGGDDWLGALSSGWSTVASATTKLATTAATATVHGSQQLAGKLQETTRSAPSTDELGRKAAETAAVAASTVSSAWGALASWTTSAVSQLTEGGAKGANGGAAADEDGLSALTRNLQHDGDANGDARFRGLEHRASPSTDPALAALARDLPRGTKYESIGGGSNASSPNSQTDLRSSGMNSRQSAASPSAAAPLVSPAQPAGAMGSRQTSAAFAVQSPVTRSSPPPASTPPAPRPAPATGGSPDLTTPPTKQEKKGGSLPSDWGWDE
jgi:ADP-ribosylation factor GTPase-activating protein 1